MTGFNYLGLNLHSDAFHKESTKDLEQTVKELKEQLDNLKLEGTPEGFSQIISQLNQLKDNVESLQKTINGDGDTTTAVDTLPEIVQLLSSYSNTDTQIIQEVEEPQVNNLFPNKN